MFVPTEVDYSIKFDQKTTQYELKNMGNAEKNVPGIIERIKYLKWKTSYILLKKEGRELYH